MLMKDGRTYEKTGIQVSVITIIINLFLFLFKLIAGFLANSGAMISDAVHSASDIFSTLIVIIGLKIAGKSADKKHPYGHEKMECIASLLLSTILFLSALGIGWVGVLNIVINHPIDSPTSFALIAALVSIVVKECMYWYTKAAAQKTNSTALMADAWHHRSDALSSVGSLIGVGGSMLGFTFLDPAASIIISLIIIKVAFDISKKAVSQLVDQSAPTQLLDLITQTISDCPGVLNIDDLKTRIHASRIYVDVEIATDENLPMIQAHKIAESVHNGIEEKIPGVKHCMVHVNPFQNP